MYCVVMDYVLQGANDKFTLSPVYDKSCAPNFQVMQKHRYQIPSDDTVYSIEEDFSIGDIVFYDSDKKVIKKPVHDKSYDTALVKNVETVKVPDSDLEKNILRVFCMETGLREIWVYSDEVFFNSIKGNHELIIKKDGINSKVVRNLTIENRISQFVKKYQSRKR